MSGSDGAAELLSSLGSIVRGGGAFAVGYVVTNGIGFVVSLVLTNHLGADLYGTYAYGNTVAAALVAFTVVGADKSVMKLVPKYRSEGERASRVLGLALGTSLLASLLVAGAVFWLAPLVSARTLDEPQFVTVLRLLAVAIPLNTLLRTTNGVFRSYDLVSLRVLTEMIVKPGARLLLIGGAVLAGLPLAGVIGAHVGGIAVSFVAAAALVAAYVPARPRFRGAGRELREYARFSVPVLGKDAARFLYRRADILMVGLLLARSDAVGIYAIVFVLGRFVALPLDAINQYFPPLASNLYERGERERLDTVYSIVTRWSFTASLFLAVGAVVYRAEILALFGPAFTAGSLLLVVVAAGQFVSGAVGPVGYLLLMTDHQDLSVANQWVFGLTNVAANYVLIREFGLLGAALATASVLAALNVTRLVELRYLEGLTPVSASFLKPLVAVAAAGVAMQSLKAVLSGTAVVFLGGTLGAAVFLATLGIVGVESADRELLVRFAE